MNETILIQFSGPDRPGLTAMLTATLAEFRACILDIGQAVVHETLALGLLVTLPEDGDLVSFRQAIAHRCSEVGLQVGFKPIAEAELQHWIASQGRDRFIITLLGRSIAARDLSRVSAILTEHNLNVDRIERLSGRMSLGAPAPNARACVELRVSGQAKSEPEMRAAFLAAAQELKLDIAFSAREHLSEEPSLVCLRYGFDTDRQGEVIDELAKMAGVGDQVVAITEAAMRGELDFKQSFTRRVGLLRGLPEERVLELLGTIPLVEGAEHLICTLKMLGYKTAILSGGFTFFARHLQSRLGIDYVFANELDIAGGTGHGCGENRHRRWSEEGGAVAGDRGQGKHLSRTSGGGGRWGQRSAHAGDCRDGNRLSRQTDRAAERGSCGFISWAG